MTYCKFHNRPHSETPGTVAVVAGVAGGAVSISKSLGSTEIDREVSRSLGSTEIDREVPATAATVATVAAGGAGRASPAKRNTAKTHLSPSDPGNIPSEERRCAECGHPGGKQIAFGDEIGQFWLHPECERPYIDRRMGEEGILRASDNRPHSKASPNTVATVATTKRDIGTTTKSDIGNGGSYRWPPGELENLCRKWQQDKMLYDEDYADDLLKLSLGFLPTQQAKTEFQHIRRLATQLPPDRRPALGPPGDSLDDFE